jgi:hypothetical protein
MIQMPMGVTTRQTRDFDILAPKLPTAIARGARDFARAQRRLGVELIEDWFNNGPCSSATSCRLAGSNGSSQLRTPTRNGRSTCVPPLRT